MRNRSLRFLTILTCLAFTCNAFTQEEQNVTSAKPKDKPTSQRLPDHFGKIALSDQQRRAIYAIQAKYDAEIQELEKKLAELKEKELKEAMGVLRPTQKQLLMELIALEKKKSEAEEATEETDQVEAKDSE